MKRGPPSGRAIGELNVRQPGHDAPRPMRRRDWEWTKRCGARITGYWAETTEEIRTHPLEGYAPGSLTRCDFATLKEGAKLT